MEETKVCRLCNEEKEITEFSINTGTKDKHDSRCKECVKDVKKNADGKSPRDGDLVAPDFDNMDWQGGKYSGTIFKRKDTDTYSVRVGKVSKEFSPNDYESDEVTIKAAYDWKKQTSDELLLTKNKYRIVKVDDEPLYIIVQLSQGYVTLLDIDMLDFVRTHTLFVGKSSTNENSKNYCRYYDRENQKIYSIHNYIIDCDVVDHISRYTLHNTKNNLRPSNHSENNKNRSRISKISIEPITGGYEASIKYLKTYHKFRTVTETDVFKTKEEARSWLKKKSDQLDAPKTPIDIQILRKEYEDIMSTYSNDFKWRDSDEDENVEKDKILTVKRERALKPRNISEKERIYGIFLDDHPDFDMASYLTKGRKLEHIIYNDDEYKFCGIAECQKWKPIDEFNKSKRTYDELERQCKRCRLDKQNKLRKKKRDAAKAAKKDAEESETLELSDIEIEEKVVELVHNIGAMSLKCKEPTVIEEVTPKIKKCL